MNRLLSGDNLVEESVIETIPKLRPADLESFVGQTNIKENLKIFLKAAKSRNEVLDHVLIYGPPGLGKTTLSHIIANEMSSNIKMTSGPVLGKVGDLAAILTNLQEKDVLFVDEIHRLNRVVEESLYSAMEDFALDIVIGEGPTARMLRITLPPFTLVGATTRLGLLTNPLKDRFGIPISLDFYTAAELKDIVLNQAKKIGFEVDDEASLEIARRSRGTPRVALRLLRRVRDFAQEKRINLDITMEALKKLKVDGLGLDSLDHKYLLYIMKRCKGGPVGIETITAGISEDQNTIEDVIEPYLLQIGFIARTPKGRVLTESCLSHISKHMI